MVKEEGRREEKERERREKREKDRQDIITALRNALDRNERLEEAVITLINAGYKKAEVLEAARNVKKPSEPSLPLPPPPPPEKG